jgi:hypothetical protein
MNKNKLKPFDLEKAKQGAEVVTRDGKPARIICWDRKGKHYPIVALVEEANVEEEVIVTYTARGTSHTNGEEYAYDLFMAPTTVEKWVNVYKCGCGYCYIYNDSEQEALEKKDYYSEYVAMTKISWEE